MAATLWLVRLTKVMINNKHTQNKTKKTISHLTSEEWYSDWSQGDGRSRRQISNRQQHRQQRRAAIHCASSEPARSSHRRSAAAGTHQSPVTVSVSCRTAPHTIDSTTFRALLSLVVWTWTRSLFTPSFVHYLYWIYNMYIVHLILNVDNGTIYNVKIWLANSIKIYVTLNLCAWAVESTSHSANSSDWLRVEIFYAMKLRLPVN